MAIADGFHVDTNGNLWLGSNRETFDATTRSEAPFYIYANGDLVAKSGTFSGNLSAAGGTFSGDISGASGTFSGNLSGSTITGGSINIGNGTFTVDSSGNLNASSGTFGGSISGDQITGGTIQGTTINADNLTISGQFSFGDISISSNDIVGTIDNGAIPDTKLGNISANKITAGTMSADRISGGTINGGLIGGGAISMTFNITSSLTVQGQTVRATGNLETGDRINHGTSQYIDMGQTTFYLRPDGATSGLQLGSTTTSYIRTNFRPNVDNSFGLGSSGSRWTDVWAVDGTINTSDITQKTDVVPATLGLDFIDTLTPIEFKWADGGVRTHLGFSAQDVKQKLIDEKGESQNYAVYVQGSYEPPSEEVDEDGNLIEQLPEDFENFGLRMQELIPVLTKAIQELSAKNDELESRIAALEG